MEFDLNNIYYQYLVKYYNESGNINVPLNYKINLENGIDKIKKKCDIIIDIKTLELII